MKKSIILGASLAANAALVAAYFVNRPAAPAPAAQAETVTNTTTRVTKGARSLRSSVDVVTNDFKWASVESEDYRHYIENLRSIGVPEETIRDIIIADVNKLYGSKIAALYPSSQDFKFWMTEDRTRSAARERERKIRELEQEKRQLLKDLLGIDVEDEMAKWSGRPDEDDVRYGFLSAEKKQLLRALQDKYRDLERGLFANGGGMNPENRAKLSALRAQREAELAQLLTPQEYEEYQLRTSWTARNMREGLSAFEPTEWEFREIFNARKAFDDQFRFNREGSDETTREQRRAAEEQLDQKLRSLLGEDRYAQYQKANDDRFREIYEYTQRANLPKETADSIYDVRKVAESERQRVLSSVPQDQWGNVLGELENETKRQLQQLLGPNWDNFSERNSWPNRLDRIQEGGRERGPGRGPGPGFEGRPELRRDRRG